ncbi:uncharacterized protein [Ranitomeya imitator]|uniref:uncharacterized protein isoform X1 n=1 Tax=Ranitomeya imitator TaxID=111125 RepID=UPI0037E96C5F
MEDAMRRWHNIRDQYRRERQQWSRSGSSALVKRKYIYFDQLSFLDPSMDLRPTQSNLTERKITGSESEPLIDPVGEGEEVAGPSISPTMFIPLDPSSADPHVQHPPGTDDSAPQTDAPASGMPEDPGHNSSPTFSLEASPQPAVTSRRGRRRRELMESRRNVDTGVLNYLARAAQDDGEEAFSRSLARYLRTIPREVKLRVRGCFQILLDACTPQIALMICFSTLRGGSCHHVMSCVCQEINQCMLKRNLKHLLHVCLHLNPFPKITHQCLHLNPFPNITHQCLQRTIWHPTSKLTNMAT